MTFIYLSKTSQKDPFLENIAKTQKVLNLALFKTDSELNNLALKCYSKFINKNQHVVQLRINFGPELMERLQELMLSEKSQKHAFDLMDDILGDLKTELIIQELD